MKKTITKTVEEVVEVPDRIEIHKVANGFIVYTAAAGYRDGTCLRQSEQYVFPTLWDLHRWLDTEVWNESAD